MVLKKSIVYKQILFYRSLDFPLNQIRELLDDPTFDHQHALIEHQRKLLEKRAEIDTPGNRPTNISTIQRRKKKMTDQEKFEGLKQK